VIALVWIVPSEYKIRPYKGILPTVELKIARSRVTATFALLFKPSLW